MLMQCVVRRFMWIICQLRKLSVARRVREAVDDRHLSMEQLAKDAHVSIQAAYSLRDSGLASLREARRVFAVLGIRVHAYPVEMVPLSL